MYKFKNLNQALVGMSKELLAIGVRRGTRGFDCIEIPNPVLICIENPCDRYVTIPERKWNKLLPFLESIWIAAGVNDLNTLPGNYVKNLYNFSDDGQFWRAGYGPRIRAYTGNYNDYKISEQGHRNVFSGGTMVVDQLKYVIESLKRDLYTRQAMIEIGDPVKDCFAINGSLKVTKDYPCTRSLHFMVNNEGKLDLIIDIRSNDLLWGFSAVNVFNFTFIQEYVADIMKIPVGKYYHKADNLHFYDNHREMIEKLAEYNIDDSSIQDPWYYKQDIESISHLDFLVGQVLQYEKSLRGSDQKFVTGTGSQMFDDVCSLLYQHHTKKEVYFHNPFLRNLYESV